MTVKSKQIPVWFKLAAYTEAANFDLSDWLVMLSHRHLWRENFEFKSNYPNGVPEEEKGSLWEAYLPSNIRVNRAGLVGWDQEGLITTPRFADITEECSKSLTRAARALRFQLNFDNR